jgi:hypothetical protein
LMALKMSCAEETCPNKDAFTARAPMCWMGIWFLTAHQCPTLTPQVPTLESWTLEAALFWGDPEGPTWLGRFALFGAWSGGVLYPVGDLLWVSRVLVWILFLFSCLSNAKDLHPFLHFPTSHLPSPMESNMSTYIDIHVTDKICSLSSPGNFSILAKWMCPVF